MSVALPEELRALRATDDGGGSLEDCWLLTICMTLLASAWPWLTHAAQVDFGAIAWGALTLGAFYVTLLAIVHQASRRARALLATLLHVAGIIVLGYIWLHAGGFQNPAFLLAFVLPVIGASSVRRRLVYTTAALSVAIGICVALLESPEFRWYVAGLGHAGAWLASRFGAEAVAGRSAFPGFYAPSGYFVALMEVFTVLVIGCALASEQITARLEGLGERVAVARDSTRRARDFGEELVVHLPFAAAIVEADSLKIVRVSDAFVAASWTAGGSAVGRALDEAVPFCFPEMVRELVVGAGGRLRPCMIRLNGELRALELRIQHVGDGRRRLGVVVMEDITLQLCARAALDTCVEPILVLDSNGSILSHNRVAGTLLGASPQATGLAGVGPTSDLRRRWWDPGVSGRRCARVDVGNRRYLVTSTAVPLPGEAESIYVLGFAPASDARATADAPTDATLVIPPLAQPP